MKHLVIIICLVFITAVFLSGCGRFHTARFNDKKAEVGVLKPPTTKLPDKPVLEWGSPTAKVRIIAFFFIDKDYQSYMDMFQSLVKQYEGKLFVRYADIRTPEGRALRSRTGGQAAGAGLLLDGQSGFTINAKPSPYEVNFDQEMGRFWTENDLRQAVAQEIEKLYGKSAKSGAT